jgi:hypothetical protein
MSALPHALRSRKVSLAVAAAISAIVTLAATLVLARPAGAIQPAFTSCSMGSITITPASGWVPLASVITLPAGYSQTVMSVATADVGVDSGAEVRLGWAFNGQTPQEGMFGPANFANHQQFFETRTTFSLIPPGFGATNVQAFVRLSGPTGTTATFLHRCVAVEAIVN